MGFLEGTGLGAEVQTRRLSESFCLCSLPQSCRIGAALRNLDRKRVANLVPNRFIRRLVNRSNRPPLATSPEYAEQPPALPSLPVVLISVLIGLGSGVFGLYGAYVLLQLTIQASAAVATLSLIAGTSGVAAGFSSLTDRQATLVNVALSCGLVMLMLIFFSLCLLIGVITATLVMWWSI
jgi:hypothetical protein